MGVLLHLSGIPSHAIHQAGSHQLLNLGDLGLILGECMWDLWWAEWHSEGISPENFSLLLQTIIPSVIHTHFSLVAVTIGHTSCIIVLHVLTFFNHHQVYPSYIRLSP